VAVGLIPLVLAAGEHVELATADERHVTLALQAWMGFEPARAASIAKTVWSPLIVSQPIGSPIGPAIGSAIGPAIGPGEANGRA
jgi:hypothetical protein